MVITNGVGRPRCFLPADVELYHRAIFYSCFNLIVDMDILKFMSMPMLTTMLWLLIGISRVDMACFIKTIPKWRSSKNAVEIRCNMVLYVSHSAFNSLIISFESTLVTKLTSQAFITQLCINLSWKELKHKLTRQAVLTMIDDASPSRPTKSDESGCGTKEVFPWLLFARINVQYMHDCKLLFARVGQAYWMGLWTFITIDLNPRVVCLVR